MSATATPNPKSITLKLGITCAKTTPRLFINGIIFSEIPLPSAVRYASEIKSPAYPNITNGSQLNIVFLVGYAACKNTSALSFLKDTVSQHKSWKVQEILAMAFDNYCKIIGYETAIPVIKEWLKSDCANTRRAVSEGLRIWTSRPYFKEHPQMAIQFLSSLKDDESEYVRKSIGNALKDISKKYPELVSNELKQWDLSSKEIKQKKL